MYSKSHMRQTSTLRSFQINILFVKSIAHCEKSVRKKPCSTCSIQVRPHPSFVHMKIYYTIFSKFCLDLTLKSCSILVLQILYIFQLITLKLCVKLTSFRKDNTSLLRNCHSIENFHQLSNNPN